MTTSIEPIQLKRPPFVRNYIAQRSLSYPESLLFAVENHCQGFYIEGSSREDSVMTFDDEKLSLVREGCANHGMLPIMHGDYRNPLSSEIGMVREAAVNYARREIDVAAKLGAPIILHASGLFTHSKVPDYKAQALVEFGRSLQALSVYAGDAGVEIWVENLEFYKDRHPFFTVFSRFEDYVSVLSKAPTNVKMILDVGHEHIAEGDPAKVIRVLGGRLAALSLSDNDGVRDGHLPLGRGALDFSTVLSAIEASGWEGNIVFETRGRPIRDDVAFFERLYHGVDPGPAAGQRARV